MSQRTSPARSEVVPLTAAWGPVTTWNVAGHLRRQASMRPDAPFLTVGLGSPATFAETLDAAERTASALWSAGVRPGEQVLMFAPTSTETVHVWLGARLIGAVDIPLNVAYRGEPLLHALTLSSATVLVVDATLLHEVRAVRDRVSHLRTIVVIGDPREEAGQHLDPGLVRLDELPRDAAWVAGNHAHSDVSTVLFTSGTSGPAKGVMMTNAQTYAIARECMEGLRMTEADTFYCFHPLFHMAGRFGALFAALLVGCRVVLDTTFTPETWPSRIRECGATVTIAHGPMIEMIHATPRRADDADNHLRAVLAAPLPAAIGHDFEDRFGVVALETWGMTEITACCWRPYDAPLRLGSAGRPREDLVELTIVDPTTDEPLPVGQVGEITVRPRHPWIIMQGYLGMPDQTVAAWRNLRFHSGDAGYLDEDGYLYFVDRLGDRIRRKAENISSYDIEVAAAAYPGVREVAAVGVRTGGSSDDEIKLCVRLDPDVKVESLFTHLVDALPHHMVPRYVERVTALPRTPTNKIRKQVLRERGVTTETWDYKDAGLSIRSLREREGTMATRGTGT